MSRVVFSDWSDNNPVHAVIPDNGAILKLYPKTNGRGWTWLTAQWPLLRGSDRAVKGFYFADSTATASLILGAAADLGIDLNEHPNAVDLREFGFSTAYVKNLVSALHAAGIEKVGHYWRLQEEVGQDWRWKADYSGTPAEPWLAHQYTDSPWDRSHTHDGVTVDEFLAATTKGAPDMALDPVKDKATFKAMLDDQVGNAANVKGIRDGVAAFDDGEPFDDAWGIYKQAGWKAAAGGEDGGGPTAPFDATITPK